MTYTIEAGIPIPERIGGSKGYTDAIRKLGVGESVHLPTTKGSAYSLCWAIGFDPGRKRGDFVVRAEGDGARVWRKR